MKHTLKYFGLSRPAAAKGCVVGLTAAAAMFIVLSASAQQINGTPVSSKFGGVIPTPALDRAALITGRNYHAQFSVRPRSNSRTRASLPKTFLDLSLTRELNRQRHTSG